MANPPTLPGYRCSKRQRILFAVDEEESDEDYIAASDDTEEDEGEGEGQGEDSESDDSDAASVEDEEIVEDEDIEIENTEDVDGTRMAIIENNDVEDVTEEAQSGRSVSSSPSSSSSQQSVKLKSCDVLDCPTCCEPLKPPIYQCSNGHVACSSCCTKLMKKCSFCKLRIGDIRCRAMEKVIEASLVPCRNAIYGCKQTTAYGNQQDHENLCVFTRCSCPLPNCKFKGSYTHLKDHARAEHDLTQLAVDHPSMFSMNVDTKKTAFFQEEKEGDVIVVQASKSSHGVYVTVSCIAPKFPKADDLSCVLAKIQLFSTLKLGLLITKVPKLIVQDKPGDEFMLIPSYMLGDGDFELQICVRKGYKYGLMRKS